MPRSPWPPLLAALGLLALVLAPCAGAAKEEVVRPFNGRTLDGWKFKGKADDSEWLVGRAVLDEKDPTKLAVTPINPAADGGPAAYELVNNKRAKRSTDIYTEQKFGDCTIEVEFM